MNMNSFSVISLLLGLIGLLPPLLILAVCIYYVTQKSNTEGILLVTGSAINVLTAIFQRIILPYLRSSGILDPTYMVYDVLGVINYIASVVFAIGLFILIHNLIKKKNNRANTGVLDEVQA